MNQSNTQPWWTNKRVFWLTFWTWVFGLALLYENQKTFDTNAIYEVTTYRGNVPVSKPRIETGEALTYKEISKISRFRTLGVLCVVTGCIGSFVIFARLSRGERIFRDAFKS
jgi:hypothetical protein